MIAIILFFGFFTATIGFISAGTIVWNSKSTGRMKLTRMGIIYVICSLILIILPIVQNYYSDKAQKKDQKALAKSLNDQYDSSISKITNQYQEGNSRTITQITDLLGKYGYKFDSVRKILTSIQGQPDPVFGLSTEPSMPGIMLTPAGDYQYKLQTTFISRGAPSTGFALRVSILVKDASKTLNYVRFERKDNFFSPDNIMPANEYVSVEKKMSIPTSVIEVLIWIRGTYKNFDETKNYKLNEVYVLKMGSNFLGALSGPTKEEVISFIKNE
jgi:hypothetical protein